jgi:DhnA family fructose-bisphosphate aldolase class Ia
LAIHDLPKELTMSSLPRLNRLFGKSGKCLDVAVDHGFFNEYSFLEGIQDLPRAIRTLVDAGPDAIQLPSGTARILQSIPGKEKPALVLRVDAANVYGKELPRSLFSRMIANPAGQAAALDAACVCINLFLLPGQPELHGQCIKNIMRLKVECERLGMPMMVEPLVFRPNQQAGGYMVDGDPAKVIPLVRQAVELGADLIKADPTDPVEEYGRVVEVASGVPVLVRGGGRAPDDEIMQRTYELMQHGIAGLVYGRNVIQHPSPAKMVKALMSIVHNGVTAASALAMLQ